jgi:acyl carrier protein
MDNVISFISEVVKKNGYLDREVTKEDKLKEDIGLDSLGILTIIDEIEEKFEVSLDPEELQKNPETVGDLASIIAAKI